MNWIIRTDPLWDPVVARELIGFLGKTLVSVLAGATDPKASTRWAVPSPAGETPTPPQGNRLRFALEQWHVVAGIEGEDVARLWFVGANPLLDDNSPVESIASDRFRDVEAAAHAMVNDSYSG